jgi:ribosomal protein S18 acetylase RimI-like enzyme
MAIKLFEDYHPDHHGARAANIVVRSATRADIVTIAPISAQREGLQLADCVAAFEREFDAIELGKVQRLLYVAEIGGAIVGFSRSSYLPTHEIDGARAMPQGWYLNGVTVDPVWRRCGVGHAITVHRITRVAERDDCIYYFVNTRNLASIDLHTKLGFQELTRDFALPGLSFVGGEGILFALRIRSRAAAPTEGTSPASIF